MNAALQPAGQTQPPERAPEYSYDLAPSTELCANGHRCFTITGRDAASQEYISDWRHWCRKCQAVTLTAFEANAALGSLVDDNEQGGAVPSIGVVVSASLRLTVANPPPGY